MTEIQLYNTASRRKEAFAPIDPDNVRMYVCGPTVYDRAHIGNARPVVVFDTLFRLLRHVHGEGHVTYVRNFTDVDDKINAKSAATGRPIRDITDETIQWYLDDMGALGALEPTHMPRCTDYIGEMVAMSQRLIDKGFAYAAEGHVLFDVSSDPNYGSLSHRSLDEMMEGARVEVAPYKRGAMDFVLWKPSSEDEPGWDSPWGRGRPGWHIECSAMAEALLGETFDIHGGGIDLSFPHHENERAQSCCAHGTERMAQVWMHNGFLMVEGEKMSKSLGNFFTVRDLLDQGYPGEVIRHVLLSTHYRKPTDWTKDRANYSLGELGKWYRAVDGVEMTEVPRGVIEALADDLNVWAAFTAMEEMSSTGRFGELKASMALLGFLEKGMGKWALEKYEDPEAERAREEIAHAWQIARDAKDWPQADAIRNTVARYGVKLSATKDRGVLVDVSSAEALAWVDSLSESQEMALLQRKPVEPHWQVDDRSILRLIMDHAVRQAAEALR